MNIPKLLEEFKREITITKEEIIGAEKFIKYIYDREEMHMREDLPSKQ